MQNIKRVSYKDSGGYIVSFSPSPRWTKGQVIAHIKSKCATPTHVNFQY